MNIASNKYCIFYSPASLTVEYRPSVVCVIYYSLAQASSICGSRLRQYRITITLLDASRFENHFNQPPPLEPLQAFYTYILWTAVRRELKASFESNTIIGFRVLKGSPRVCSASRIFARAKTHEFYARMRKKSVLLLSSLQTIPNLSLITVAARYYYSSCVRHFTQILIGRN